MGSADLILWKLCLNKSPGKASEAELLCNGRPRRRRLSPWKRVSYVVGVDVCVVPLQAVIQDGDDHSFPCDALLPHWDHMQVQFGQRGRRPCVLLEKKQAHELKLKHLSDPDFITRVRKVNGEKSP